MIGAEGHRRAHVHIYMYNVYNPFFIQLELMKRPNFGVETSGGSPS
jgi:hypothetical protein